MLHAVSLGSLPATVWSLEPRWFLLALVAARLYVDAQRSRGSERQPLGGASMRLHEWQALDSVVSSA